MPIAVVAGCCFRHDAISSAVLHTLDALNADPGYRASLLTSHIEMSGREGAIVRDASDLLLHPDFRNAEAIIYHFGIYHPLFDVITVGNGKARQAAFFHNITPPQFLPPGAAETIEKSYRQLNNLRFVERIWPVSRTNAETLLELDFDRARMEIIPLAVGTPGFRALGTKRMDRIDILFLGRVVTSKGIIDLIEAVAALPRSRLPPFRLSIAGNLAHSDAECVAMVRSLIDRHGLSEFVHFLGTIEDAQRDLLLQSSHIMAIPSYHEGFCKPVIEGLRAGCVPLGYAAYNLRHIAGGLGRMVAAGSISALSGALASLIGDIYAAGNDPRHKVALDSGPLGLEAFSIAAQAHVAEFEPERIAQVTRERVGNLLSVSKAPTKVHSWQAAARDNVTV